MDLAWFLVCSSMLFVSLLATISHVDDSDGRSGSRAHLNADDIPFCQVVFGQFNHRIADAEASELQRRWLAINFQTLLLEKNEEIEAMQTKTWRVYVRRTIGILFSFIITAVTVTGISLLIYYEVCMFCLLFAHC